MARIRIPLGRTFGKGRSTAAGMQSSANLYPEPVEAEGRTDVVFYGTPGRASFATIGGTPRGQLSAGGVHYVVNGSRLYSVNSSGTETDLGQIIGSGLVDMSFNGVNLDIVTDQDSYSFLPSTATLSVISDGDFEPASSVTNLAGRSIFTRRGTGEFAWSSYLDSTAYNALHFATAEAESDDLICARKVGNEVALIGANTVEWWYNTGDIDSLFARVNAPAASVGGVSRDATLVVDSALTFPGRDGSAGGVGVYRAEGYSPRKISTPEIDGYLESVATLTDLHAFPFQSRGHLFYVLTNPNEWSFGWDVSTNQWIPLKYGLWTMGAEPSGGWDATMFALNGQKQIIGSSDGNLYELQADTNTEGGAGIVREVTSQQIHRSGKRCFMSRLELDIEAGVGTTGNGNPTVFASWSDDGGKTWSQPRESGMGAIGENKWRAVWNACGSFRQRIIKFRVSDAVKVAILGSWADMTVGAH